MERENQSRGLFKSSSEDATERGERGENSVREDLMISAAAEILSLLVALDEELGQGRGTVEMVCSRRS